MTETAGADVCCLSHCCAGIESHRFARLAEYADVNVGERTSEEYQVFNIGKAHTNEWWREQVQRGVITAGFDAKPGDRGDVIFASISFR